MATWALERVVDSRSQRGTYGVDKEGEANGYGTWRDEAAKSQILEFRVKFGWWQKTAETNDSCIS